MSYKDEIIDRLEKLGIDVKKDLRDSIRPKSAELINMLLDKVENTTTHTTNTTINTTKSIQNTTKDTTKIEEPITLSPIEEQIVEMLKDNTMRFREIRDTIKQSDGSTYNYLKSLQEKDLIDKKAFSRKNVVYFAI